MAQSLSETLIPGMSYWLAYDESLNSHLFRVIKYETISSTYYTTEYGSVSTRRKGERLIVDISPKQRNAITIVFGDDEEVTEQDLLSLLIYWTVKPLFLAVPVPETNEEQAQQEPLF